MHISDLLKWLEQTLQSEQFQDYCPNGLQIEGREQIKTIVTGVTACQALIDNAIELNADAILVHHGFFWKSESPVIRGMKRKRIKQLIENDINLLAYHLPLDTHPTLGNNAQLANRLGLVNVTAMDGQKPNGIVMCGRFVQAIGLDELGKQLNAQLSRMPTLVSGGNHKIETVAWCTGGGQGYIDAAAAQGVDAFISGEISEQTVHSAREQGIHYISAGHHATERYGVKALGEKLHEVFGLNVQFIDIDNPA